MKRILCLLTLCWIGAAAPCMVAAQAVADVAPPAEAPDQDALAQQIATVRQQAADSTAEQLKAEDRKLVLETLDKAAALLAKAKEFAGREAKLEKELADATKESAPEAKPAEDLPKPLDRLSLEELQLAQSAADQAASRARERFQAEKAEIENRVAERQDLPNAMIKAREQITQAEDALRADYSADHPLLAAAKRLYQQARLECARKELQYLEQADRTYNVTARWKAARRDQLAAKAQAAEARLAEVTNRVAAAQQRDADRRASQAKHAQLNAHPAVAEQAKRNAELAEKNAQLVQEKENLRIKLDAARAAGDAIRNDQQRITTQAEELKNSPTIGALLQNDQDELPDVAALRRKQQERSAEMAALREQKYQWRRELDEITPIEKSVADALRSYQRETGAGEAARDDIERELRKAFESRQEILESLVQSADDNLSYLHQLNVTQAATEKEVQELSNFIAERVFWTPSAERISFDDLEYVYRFWSHGGARLADLQTLGMVILTDVKARPELWLLASMLALLLVAWRRRAKRLIFEAGERAARPAATNFRPTVTALAATLFLSAPTPLLIGFVGWRLEASTVVLAYAAGAALALFASQYAVLDVIRHACRPGGLGPQHFNWDHKGLVSLRRAARPLQLIALPLLAIAIGVETARDDESIDSLGRLSLIMSLLVMGGVAMLFFRVRGPLITALTAGGASPWFARFARALGPLSVAAALALAVGSGLGMHYTALQLTRRILFSFGVLAACIGVRALLMRWLLLAYRRVAMQRAREKRQALLEAQENAPVESAAIEVEPEVSLSDINQQARSLVGVGVTACIVGSMLLVWGDVLPALGVLQNFTVWTSGIPTEEGIRPPVTLAGLFLSLGVLVLTWFAGRNVPGLLEIVLFQKLPLDAGARYAATSVSRYVIVVIGVVLGMRLIGIGWQSVQWLVAAMTVGLGFGLQEIFANFVSGIILLFERPVRPGDVVTIGDVSGVVTRIRIRATTVQDWDNKELIVPNREFITGNLINWTLSSRVLRYVLKVGVAYGSDTRLATELLYKIARENPDVVETPEPFVLFESFGDSTLNFELRVFTQDLSNMLPMRNALMLAVDDEFRKHHIEIAFPQRDLHIRSMPAGLTRAAGPEGQSADDRMFEQARTEPGFGYAREN